ncbi:hypothetical protein B0F90DRAFT_1666084 [Multifurca ochricompacta]|uniref:Uncharacterized protein n=1 Tax=Multifurca ochricompacta TaxID=376703 RepID=A0AAD4M8T3_9AGAM|nr:hypothetical protein B0F90DRAFT_1666084 [Multifurca ochricompacta]
MSPPHAHTTGIISSMQQVDEDDDDICPICEGACTCNNKPIVSVSAPFAPSSRPTHNQTSSQALPSSSVHTHPSTPAPLKIKLTIPTTLLARTRLPTSKNVTPPSKKQSKSLDTYNRDKRTGRPLKTGVRAAAHPGAHSGVKDKRAPKSKAKDMTGKALKRQKTTGGHDEGNPSGVDSASSRRSHYTAVGSPVKVYGQITQDQDFPTFVSADEFSSANESSAGPSSSSEESELTDFSDSSIADEEEYFIRTTEEQRARAHDKARVKRELLGDDMTKRKERRTDWEIRSRKKSVSPSDNSMDVDSDETDDEAEEGVEEAEGNDGEDDDEDGIELAQRSYVGIATGWSEDEESSFDADLFFAGLSDSDSGPELPNVPSQEIATDTDEDNSSVDIEPSSVTQGIFEITEGWDGSVIFTNGLQDGQGLLDWDFEANATQLLIEAAAMSDSGSDADVRMSESEGVMGDSEDENDSLEEVESNDGDTTEEELIDDRGLPTARAMRLFRPPVIPLFSINPLSTMRPGPRVRDALSNQSPQPLDILAGRGFAVEDEDAPEPPMSEISSVVLSASSDRGTPRFPLMGTFEAARADSLHRAVIDGSRYVVPSPFQRSRRRRPSESASAWSVSRSRDRSLSLSHASFALSPTIHGVPSLSDDPALLTSPGLPPAEPIRLDDVLDTSILDSDPVDAPATPRIPCSIIGDPETSPTDDGVHHLQSLSRWDRIPMGTFRRTRESGPLSDGPGELPYDNIIRSSPFSGMWPSDRNHNPPSGSPSRKCKGKKSSRKVDMVISPVIMPVRDRDGDHTPTGHAIGQNNHGPMHSKPRKDKESRRDKVLKRKTLMGTAIGRRHQQHHHAHGHHPNSKGRASGSIQRTGVFSGGSVPPLNL